VRKASPMTEVDLADAVLQVRDLVLPILDDLR
jgi:hypothetical protein